jgi:hypothetical protein
MCDYTKHSSESVVPDLSAQSERQLQNTNSPHQTSNSSHQSADALPHTNQTSTFMLQLGDPAQQVEGTPLPFVPVPVSGAPRHHGAAFPFNMDQEPLNVFTMAALVQPARLPEHIRRMRRAQSNRESAKRAKRRREQNLSNLEASLQEANDTVKKLEEEVKELNDRVKSLNEKLQKESASRFHTASPMALSEQGRQAAADITFPLPMFSIEDWDFED